MKFDWDDYVQALHIYINEHGDCVVPQGYKVEMTGMNLGKWVQNQRQNKRNNKLARERIDELNALQFRWNCGTTSASSPGKKKKRKKTTGKKKRKKADDDDDDDDDEPISKLKAKKSRAKAGDDRKPPAKRRRTTKAKAKSKAVEVGFSPSFESAVEGMMDLPSDMSASHGGAFDRVMAAIGHEKKHVVEI